MERNETSDQIGDKKERQSEVKTPAITLQGSVNEVKDSEKPLGSPWLKNRIWNDKLQAVDWSGRKVNAEILDGMNLPRALETSQQSEVISEDQKVSEGGGSHDGTAIWGAEEMPSSSCSEYSSVNGSK